MSVLATSSTRLLAFLPALAAAFVVSTAASASPQARCPPNLTNELATTRSASQLVTVTATSMRATSGSLELWQRDGLCWTRVAGPWVALLGIRGLSDHHREGDGTTPTGAFGIGPVIYGVAPNPGVRYHYHRLVCGDWWDEDPGSAAYNTFQHVACGASPPFGGGSEPLWQSARAYAHFAVIEYNAGPVVPGRGSAIFIHADKGSPTNGCVSLPLGELDRLLRWLTPARSPLIVIGTATEIRRL